MSSCLNCQAQWLVGNSNAELSGRQNMSFLRWVSTIYCTVHMRPISDVDVEN